MTTTSMPGFTAEIALYKKREPYMAGIFDRQTHREYVQPAAINACDVLSHSLWEAYLSHSYTAAQFYYDAMVGAGCFK